MTLCGCHVGVVVVAVVVVVVIVSDHRSPRHHHRQQPRNEVRNDFVIICKISNYTQCM